jgi:hypothetical protein
VFAGVLLIAFEALKRSLTRRCVNGFATGAFNYRGCEGAMCCAQAAVRGTTVAHGGGGDGEFSSSIITQ